MRPGTFIYHSHLDDISQLTGGLYGALIVLGEGEEFDPELDHLAIVGWRNPLGALRDHHEISGAQTMPDIETKVGGSHRIRLINIAPAGNVFISMKLGEEPYHLVAVAKDGADLPGNQRVEILTSESFGVGETADFMFSP